MTHTFCSAISSSIDFVLLCSLTFANSHAVFNLILWYSFEVHFYVLKYNIITKYFVIPILNYISESIT